MKGNLFNSMRYIFKPLLIAILLSTFFIIKGGSEICSNPPENCHPIPGRDSCFRENNSSRNSDWLTSARTCEQNGGRLLWLYNNNITEFMKNNTKTSSTSPCPNCTFMWIGLMQSTFHNDQFFWKRTQNETKEQCRISTSNETCAFNVTKQQCELLGCCYTTSNCLYAGDVETDRQHEYHKMNQAFHNTSGYRRCVGLHKPNDNSIWAFSVENCSKRITYTHGYFCEHRCGSSWPVPIAKPNNTHTNSISPDWCATFTSTSSLPSTMSFFPTTIINSIITNKSKGSTSIVPSGILSSMMTNRVENKTSVWQSFTLIRTQTPIETNYLTNDLMISPSDTISPSIANNSLNTLSVLPSPTISTQKTIASTGSRQLSSLTGLNPTSTPVSTKNVSRKTSATTIFLSTTTAYAPSSEHVISSSLPELSTTTSTPTQNVFFTSSTSYFDATINIAIGNTPPLRYSALTSTTTNESVRNMSFSPLTTIFHTTVNALNSTRSFQSTTLSPKRKIPSASSILILPSPSLRPTIAYKSTGDTILPSTAYSASVFIISTSSTLLLPSTSFYATTANTSAHPSSNSSTSQQKITNINTNQGSNGYLSAGAIVGISVAVVVVVVVSSITTILCIRHLSKTRIGLECNESPGLSMTQNNVNNITFNTEREPTEYHESKDADSDSPIQTAS